MARQKETMVKPVALPPVSLPSAGTKFDFGHTRRCPRCGSTQTRLDGVGGRYAFRACQVAICRHRWKVVGQPI